MYIKNSLIHNLGICYLLINIYIIYNIISYVNTKNMDTYNNVSKQFHKMEKIMPPSYAIPYIDFRL